MQQALRQGRITSGELVTQYLLRIAVYEDTLNAAITVNSRALYEAGALDTERSQRKIRGPLHGSRCDPVRDRVALARRPA